MSLVNSSSAEINQVLSEGVRLNSNIMTIFTYLHFCLKEQKLALLTVPPRENIWKGKMAWGRINQESQLKTVRKAAGNTQRTARSLLLTRCRIFHLSRGSAQRFAPYPNSTNYRTQSELEHLCNMGVFFFWKSPLLLMCFSYSNSATTRSTPTCQSSPVL